MRFPYKKCYVFIKNTHEYKRLVAFLVRSNEKVDARFILDIKDFFPNMYFEFRGSRDDIYVRTQLFWNIGRRFTAPTIFEKITNKLSKRKLFYNVNDFIEVVAKRYSKN